MNPKILYEKRGRKYVPVREEFSGFPKAGVWIVTGAQGKQAWSGYWMMRLGDTPTVMTYAAFDRHRDAIACAISNVQNWTCRSPSDMAHEVIKAVYEAEEKVKP